MTNLGLVKNYTQIAKFLSDQRENDHRSSFHHRVIVIESMCKRKSIALDRILLHNRFFCRSKANRDLFSSCSSSRRSIDSLHFRTLVLSKEKSVMKEGIKKYIYKEKKKIKTKRERERERNQKVTIEARNVRFHRRFNGKREGRIGITVS